MADRFAESTAQLQQLVPKIMKETDPAHYDRLAEEIWRVLAERERLEEVERTSSKRDFPNPA